MACCPGYINLQGLSDFDKVGVDGFGVVVVDDKDILVPAWRDDQ